MVRELREMLEGKNYKSVDSGLPILAAFIDRCTGWIEEAILTKEHVFFPKLFLSMAKDEIIERWNEMKLNELQLQENKF